MLVAELVQEKGNLLSSCYIIVHTKYLVKKSLGDLDLNTAFLSTLKLTR